MWWVKYTFIHVAPSLEQLLPRRADSCPPDVDIPATKARERAERCTRRRRAKPKKKSKAAQKQKAEAEDFDAIVAEYQARRREELENMWIKLALLLRSRLPSMAAACYEAMRRRWELWAQLSRRRCDQQEGKTTLECAVRLQAVVHEPIERMLPRMRAAMPKKLFLEIISVLFIDPADEQLLKEHGTVREKHGRVEIWCPDEMLCERPMMRLLDAVERMAEVRAACAFHVYIVNEARK